MLAGSIGRVEVGRRWRIGAAKRPVVAHIGPQSPGARPPDIEHRHGGVVGMDTLGRKDVTADRLDQRHQGGRRCTDPVSQGRDVELDALAGIGRALTRERQVQAVLGKQHVRQQPRPRASARNRMRRRRWLGDLLAAPARVLLAHMLDHLPLARHQLQALGHVLAQLVQNPAAARAGRRNRIDHALARQVLGQRPPGRLAPLERLHRHALRHGDLFRRLRLDLILLELEQLQLELVQQGTPLRRLPEPIVLQLDDPVLELLDLQLAQLGQPLRNLPGRPLGQHHRLQRLNVVGQRGGRGHITY
jgi:hypothetical protein